MFVLPDLSRKVYEGVRAQERVLYFLIDIKTEQMNSSELLRLQLANNLYCRQQGICSGNTALTPTVVGGLLKSFTLYLDYSVAGIISRVYIPPGFFTTNAASGLSDGGVFTGNVGTDLVFVSSGGLTISLSCNNTSYAIVGGIQVSGYSGGTILAWQPAPGQNIGNTKIYFSVKNPNTLVLGGLDLTNINAGNLTYPSAGQALQDWLATVTIFYI